MGLGHVDDDALRIVRVLELGGEVVAGDKKKFADDRVVGGRNRLIGWHGSLDGDEVGDPAGEGNHRNDDPDELPNFDVLLLGVGPDGHCASLFPEHPSAYDDSGPVIAVRNSPKPPPSRISLSFQGLAAANAIWFVASGAGKAQAVALALSGAGRVQVPSAGPRGRFRTLWLVDRDAASRVPRNSDGRPTL